MLVDRTLVVVTRVAQYGEKLDEEMVGITPMPRGAPSEEWVAERSITLEHVAAASLRLATVPFHWVWRVCEERRDQVQEISDRIWPDAILVDEELEHDAIPGEHFLGVRLDSDDAYLPSVIDSLPELDLEPSSIVTWQEGYKFRPDWVAVAEWAWGRKTQGGFLAVTLDGRPEMLDVPGPHNPARRGREHIVYQSGRSWLWTIHGANSRIDWGAAEALPREESEAVLEQFGI